MADSRADPWVTVDALVGDQAAAWDLAGRLPEEVLRKLAGDGLLCAQVPAEYGGLGLSSQEGGAFTAHAGSRCSSLRMRALTMGRCGE